MPDFFLAKVPERVGLCVTTHCNLWCPECCCRVGQIRHPRHFGWAYFEDAARHLRGIRTVHVTGGEPTSHPEFPRMAREFKALFGCGVLSVETNGLGVDRVAADLALFDVVYFSRYSARSWEGSPDNRGELGRLQRHLAAAKSPARLEVRDVVHTPRTRTGAGDCLRGRSASMAYWDGRLYPCCVAPGVDGAEWVALDGEWRGKIMRAPMPCARCRFAGSS